MKNTFAKRRNLLAIDAIYKFTEVMSTLSFVLPFGVWPLLLAPACLSLHEYFT